MKSIPSSARWAKDFLVEGIEAIEHQHRRCRAQGSLPTGLRPLDWRLDGGLQAGEMTVVAGRPCAGKTSLALGIAGRTAIDSKQPTVFFALENSSRQLAMRLLCAQARVSLDRVRAGRLTDDDFPRLIEAGSRIVASPLLIDEARALTAPSLGRRLRCYAQSHGVKLAVIDHLHLLRPEIGRSREDRRAGMAAVSADLKSLAMELKIPLVILCPLNRRLENRTRGRPRLEDIKGSRLIAQDADVVILLFREEYYASTAIERRRAMGKITLIVAKQPQGLTGDITLRFEERFAQFHE